jgi:3-oxoacyl-[acyl-carrier protein] reductase
VAISTGGTKLFMAGGAVYLGSKGAVEQFVRTLAYELAQRQITVNAVSPGFTETDMLPGQFREYAPGRRHSSASVQQKRSRMSWLSWPVTRRAG